MTLEQLQYFIVSLEAGSFSGAAKRLFVSHSSVSRGVAALETELGVQLLVRGRRSLSCTPAGETFLRQSRELLRQAVQLRDGMARYRTRQRLQIVSIGAYMPDVYAMLRSFREARPEVELLLEQADQNTVREKLRSGQADLSVGFSYTWPEDSSLEYLAVGQGRFCALVSPDHPFASRDCLTREELEDCPDLLGENPFHTDEAQRPTTVQDIPSIIWQIKAGRGITVLPEHAAVEFGHGCVQTPIQGTVNEYQLLMAWRRENTSAALKAAVSFFWQQLNPQEKPEV